MAGPIQIGIVGIGKIARDQHIPALRADPAFHLTAGASPHAGFEGLEVHHSLDEMLDAHPDLDAVALCTPPQERYALAHAALSRGKHVFLEKPPGSTLSEVEALRQQAKRMDRTLFASWHSRFAPAVEPARQWLAERTIKGVRIDWREDVRQWHPGQEWIWRPGGLGVFDPGINALSIATAILPRPFFLTDAELRFPANRAAPVAADLRFSDETGIEIIAGFDWLRTGPQTWDIRVETDQGRLRLSLGGSVMAIDEAVVSQTHEAEYPGLYRRFAQLIAQGRSDVDVSPMRHVADAFLRGRRVQTAPFED
ncbi:MAG: Gfo/Idh/MocA family oxidoreductase [Caulobacteraceae bacterium]|nr:Gfo/Idh/MocA family oxidoreductase [Caulobacteraceae bacterium]